MPNLLAFHIQEVICKYGIPVAKYAIPATVFKYWKSLTGMAYLN